MNSQNTNGPLTLFRVHVEDIDRAVLRRLVAERFPEGANILYGEGLWQGQREQNATIEVYAHESARGDVTALAHALKEAFGQQAVGIAELNDRTQYYNV